MDSIVFKPDPEETKDLLQTCRLCLSEESTECALLDQNLSQWISNYLSIQISAGDGLSKNICVICRIRLTEFHQFRERCQEVQNTLQSIIHTENLKNYTELSLNNEPASDSYPGIPDIQENDTQNILTEIDNENFHPENGMKINENNTQSTNIDSENEKALTRVQNIEIDGVIDIEEVNIKLKYYLKPPDKPLAEGDQYKQCTICKEVFSHKNQLYRHQRRDHGGKYSCPICKRPFKNGYMLRRHMIIHEADAARPFKCDVCHREFKRKDDVSLHKKRVHGPKMYKCSTCGSCFSTSSDLARHMRTDMHNGDQSTVRNGKHNRTKRREKVTDCAQTTAQPVHGT